MEARRISHFELLDPLGRGGMGEVYRARDTLLEREVALKLIHRERSADPHARQRFLRECRTAAALNHPSIATLFEAGETEDGQLFYVSELVPGENLAARLGHGRLPPAEALDLGLQLADALAAAHERGIVHRDVKPANVMVTPAGRVKVLDFGLARLVAPTGEAPRDEEATATLFATRSGVVGTPAYMSPEQAVGDPADARSDVFSAGCVLYEALTGATPFAADTLAGTLRRVLTVDPPSADSIDRGVPPSVGAVLRRALAKDPAARYASGAELAAALRGLAPASAAIDGRSARGGRPFRAGLALAGGALFLAASALVLWWSARPGLAFVGTRDRLLIASVDNQTEDVAFDLALRTALEADLQRSRHVTVFDQGQIADTLRLMRRDAATPVDESLGRDVCRFAGVRALLLPRILAVGQAFELQAILVDPASGRHVDRIRVTARGREEVLLHAIDELAREVRSRLGESLSSIAAADASIAQVTTSSWEALQYFSLAHVRTIETRFSEAATLLERALEKDPQFAGARGTLGLLLLQFLDRREEGRALLAQAFAESAALPEWERLMLRALHRQFVDRDLEGALEEYRLLAELYPNRMEPLQNSGQVLLELGRYTEAEDRFERALTVTPQGQVSLSSLFWLHIRQLGDPRAAERDARRLVELGPDIAQFHHYLAWSLWAQERLDEALVEVRRVLALDPNHAWGRPNLGHLLLRTGAAAEAATVYQDLLATSQDRRRLLGFATLALRGAGRIDEARQVARPELDRAATVPDDPRRKLDLALLAAASGDEARARTWIDEARGASTADAELQVRLAQAHAVLGETEPAIDALERALELGYWDRYFLVIAPGLAGIADAPRFRQLVGLDAGAEAGVTRTAAERSRDPGRERAPARDSAPTPHPSRPAGGAGNR